MFTNYTFGSFISWLLSKHVRRVVVSFSDSLSTHRLRKFYDEDDDDDDDSSDNHHISPKTRLPPARSISPRPSVDEEDEEDHLVPPAHMAAGSTKATVDGAARP